MGPLFATATVTFAELREVLVQMMSIISNTALVQLTCNAKPPPISEVAVRVILVNQPETIPATANVNAIIRTVAIIGDIPLFRIAFKKYLLLFTYNSFLSIEKLLLLYRNPEFKFL